MRTGKGIVFLAVAFFIFVYPMYLAHSETSNPTTTITITKNEVNSASPHTVSNFQPSVDLGAIAGLSQSILNKYMDSLCGISSGSSGGGIMGTANTIAGNLLNAVTPPSIGGSSQNQSSLSLSGGSGPNQSTVNLTPAQVAAMQQSGSVVVINRVEVPAGTQSITISPPATTANASTQSVSNATAVVFSGNASAISLPTNGTYQVANAGSYNQMTIPREQNTPFAVPYVSGLTFTLPLAIVLDTFFASEPNYVTKATLKASWDISQADLNEFNRQRAMGTLVPFGSMGEVSLKTDKFEMRREFGARCDVGLSVQWKGALRKLANVQFADWALEINDPSEKNGNVNDPLSAQSLRHSDELVLSELASIIIDKISGSSAKAAKEAGDESLSDKILDKIIGEFGIKVLVVHSTLNRKVTASFKATGKDFSGKTIALTVAGPIVFDSDDRGYPVNITFPNDCPPLKEIKLIPTDVVYTFEEHAYPDVVLTGFGQELYAGSMTERAELFAESSFTMTDWISSGGDMKIAVDQRPVIYPVRGNIAVGNPPGGLQGAQVRIFTKAPGGHESNFNTVDSNPAGDFVGDVCLFATGSTQPTPPQFVIEVSKAGYQTITSTANPDRFVKTKDNPLTYQINMPLSTAQMLAVSGRVLDISNQGIPGAEVLLSCAGVQYQTTSDASGAYSFPAVLFGSSIQLHANKTGLYLNPEGRSVSSGTKSVTVDLKSVAGQRWGDAKFTFNAESGSLPGSVNVTRSSTGRSFSLGIPTDGVVNLAVIGPKRDTFTFSKENYTVTPGSVTAEFTGNEDWYPDTSNAPVVPVKAFNIAISSRIPSAATLSADKSSIERYGSFYNPAGDKEKAVLTTKVVDSAGRPVGGANVRFEITGAPVKILKEGTRPEGAGPTSAYAQSDSSGNAQVTICSMRELGAANITAGVYYGDIVYNMRSNGYSIDIIENTRPERAGKPTCTITAEAANLAVSGPGVNIAVGGDILFHLTQNTNSQLGTLTGYKFLYSKNNGSAQEESFNTAPHPVARKTFTEAGSYNVQYLVKRTFDDTDTWSDPAQVAFTVTAYQPPRAVLTLPRTSGSVNLPVDYSFDTQVSAPYKQILITFGDNQGNVDLDAGLLNAKFAWSGTYFHTYTSEGTFQVKLKVTDQSNAFKEEIKQVTIGSIASLNDNTPPTGSISINNGAATTDGKSVVIHATATDNISGVYRMRYSNDGSNWSSWNGIAIDDRPYPSIVNDRVWQLTDGAGTKTVYVQFKDAADNVSPSFTDTIQLQSASVQASGALPAPQVTVTGYQGAPMPYGSVSIASRSGNNISVAFSAHNDWAIFVDQMSLSFDNQSWSAWMPFEDNKQVSLDGHLDAAKLYVIYADKAGGMSPVYSANIPAAPAVQAQAAPPAEMPAQSGAQQQAVQQQSQGSGVVSGTGGQAGAAQSATGQKGAVSERKQREALVFSGDARIAQESARAVEPLKKEPVDISLDDMRLPAEIIAGKSADIEVIVRNNSPVDVEKCVVVFEAQDGFNTKEMINLRRNATEKVKFAWTPREPGKQRLSAELELEGDADRSNNRIKQSVEVLEGAGAGLGMPGQERSEEELPRKKGSRILKGGEFSVEER